MPLPFTARQKLFRFLSTSVIVAKIAYALKISFIFIAVLFVDAVQRMLRVSAEGQQAKQAAGATDVRTETNYAAKKFYTQRNMYLTGFTLFLSLILTRTYYILLDLIHSQEQYAELKKKTEGSPPTKDQAAEIAELKKKLAASEAQSRDLETLKKQAKQQAVEYDRLATELNKATGQVSNKKSD
ncbi:endoplasmic reticulum protein [Rhizoctonia solani]|uniref:Endoplasmic reticulum transmembrane protein n=1 Tax=Rhizoctonia solani TaxID=456999 RepID=A0A8H7H267_9AGAM|nr:endoplasmic reticulum protein [Rhizoctonia solani]